MNQNGEEEILGLDKWKDDIKEQMDLCKKQIEEEEAKKINQNDKQGTLNFMKKSLRCKIDKIDRELKERRFARDYLLELNEELEEQLRLIEDRKRKKESQALAREIMHE